MKTLLAASLFLLSLTVIAGGDKAGEAQPEPRVKLPPSPPLPAAEALKAFKTQPGFRIELIASEPLIQDPVAMAFDGDGRMWVVEMTSYMPDADGTGEESPVGRVVVLEDTDGDWKMDKRTVFVDKLVLPRAISLIKGGILIAEVPKLIYCRDKDGDLVCDEQIVVASDYGIRGNPQHLPNGLIRAVDNWIYSADFGNRFRYEVAPDGSLQWMRSRVSLKGQWGLAQDDFGRFYFNNNSVVLQADCVPSHYFNRNSSYKNSTGINILAVNDQSTWPARPNPGVNRGYRVDQLRADSTLATVTAACGPCVYRADQFPAEYRGNVFICEPAGNLIQRIVISENNGMLSGKNVHEKTDFIASTDERFRPVNLYTGPDGTMYVLDIYRGILEHRLSLTTYLKKQIIERGLDKPINLGRIYRIVHEDSPVSNTHPKMSAQSPEELVGHLSNPNGWWRDTAQRLLVERNDKAATKPLRELATSGTSALGRMHALWTLEGVNRLDQKTLFTALDDQDAHVKATAIRLCEILLKRPPIDQALAKLIEQANDTRTEVQLQLAFTLGETADAKAMAALAEIMKRNLSNPLIVDAVFTSVGGRETELAALLIDDPNPEMDRVLAAAANCVYSERRPESLTKLLDLIGANKEPRRQAAMLEGILKPPGAARAPKLKQIEMATPPPALANLSQSTNVRVAKPAADVAKLIVPPGTIAPPKKLAPLTADQQALYDHGKTQYMQICAQCHQPSGSGEAGKAPPFIESEWATFSDERLVRIVLNGLKGPLNVNGREYTLEMPGIPKLDDKTIAGCLTYIRREFGSGEPLDPATVERIRKELGTREEQWTEAEIMKIK